MPHQEVVVETETERTLKSNIHASKCQETLKELLHAYAIDTQLGAERCVIGLGITAITVPRLQIITSQHLSPHLSPAMTCASVSIAVTWSG